MTQAQALEILKTGRNVFLTGAAGSGKTHTLREYIKYLRELNADVAITASTGIAATHMGGMTIHSWSGLGIKDFLSDRDLDDIADKPHVRSRIKNTSILIIDEVSMLDHGKIDLIDAVLRRVKDSNEPFGGLQIIFCGDFFQLPPINRGDRGRINEVTFEFEERPRTKFAYHSPVWQGSSLKICYLEEQHRQEDTVYLKVLNAIRDNNVEEEVVEILNGRLNAGVSHFEPTKLYSHNVDVDGENEKELGKITGETFKYVMESRGARNVVESLKKSCLAPETLKLKRGAKVMFVKNNFEEGFVNGTLGVVERLSRDNIVVTTLAGKKIEVPLESWRVEEDGRVLAEIGQYPLRLAWAITVHKSQGMSLDAAEIDLRDCFEQGMGYVALSRVRTLAGLSLKGFNNIALQVSGEVLEFDQGFRLESEKNVSHINRLGGKVSEMQEQFKNKIKREKDDEEDLGTYKNGRPKRKRRTMKEKMETHLETRKFFESGMSIAEIAKERNLAESTIFTHIEKVKKQDPSFNIYALKESIPNTKFQKIYQAFQKVGTVEGGKRPLAPVQMLLGNKFSFEDLRLVRLFL